MKNIGKRLAVAALATTFVCGSAFASKARMEALGEDVWGSRSIEDNRNWFVNPANVLYGKSHFTIELGNDSDSSDFSQANDGNNDGDVADSGSNEAAGRQALAEGGVVWNMDNMALGLYMGGESNTGKDLVALAGGVVSSSFLTPDQILRLAFAMKFGGMDVGLSTSYMSISNKNAATTAFDDKSTGSSIGAALGVKGDGWSFDFSSGLGTTFEDPTSATQTDKFEGKSGFTLGGHYDFMGVRVHGEYYTTEIEATNDEATDVIANGKLNDMGLYVTKTAKAGKATTYLTVGYYTKTLELTHSSMTAASIGAVKGTLTNMPIKFAAEYKALDWLTLRGSVSTLFMGSEKLENWVDTNAASGAIGGAYTSGLAGLDWTVLTAQDGEATSKNTTTASAGASLTYGDFQIDGLIALGGSSAGTGITNNGVFSADSLLSRVSLNYTW